MKKKFALHQDLVMGIFFLIISALFYFGAKEFPEASAQFPRLFSIIMAGLSVIVIVKGIQSTKKLNDDLKEDPNTKVALSWKELRAPVYTMLAIGCYILGILYVGFFVASAVFMVAFMWILNYRNIKVIAFTTIVLLGGIWLVFVKLLSIGMPTGLLF